MYPAGFSEIEFRAELKYLSKYCRKYSEKVLVSLENITAFLLLRIYFF